MGAPRQRCRFEFMPDTNSRDDPFGILSFDSVREEVSILRGLYSSGELPLRVTQRDLTESVFNNIFARYTCDAAPMIVLSALSMANITHPPTYTCENIQGKLEQGNGAHGSRKFVFGIPLQVARSPWRGHGFDKPNPSEPRRQYP